MWYQKKKKFLQGIETCLKLTDEDFQNVITQVYEVFKVNEEDLSALTEIEIKDEELSGDERILVLKSVFYLVQRLNMFILSPLKLQADLNELGLTPEKAQIILKFYSDISKDIVKNLDINTTTTAEEEVLWEIKTTLSDQTNQKCKIPKAKITLKSQNQELTLDDLNHSQLTKLFDKLEIIQTELDNLNKN